jgi:tRNA threonylcarbamoyl adenosine modification protein YjeE
MESFLRKNFNVLYTAETASKDATIRQAEKFSLILKAGDIVALSGNLGAGKTHFVKGIVKGAGGSPKKVQSPTFNLVKTYETSKGFVHHFDFYRLKGFDELERTGYRELISDSGALSVVEWPEIVSETWQDFNYAVRLENNGENRRKITVYGKNKAAGKTTGRSGKDGKGRARVGNKKK